MLLAGITGKNNLGPNTRIQSRRHHASLQPCLPAWQAGNILYYLCRRPVGVTAARKVIDKDLWDAQAETYS